MKPLKHSFGLLLGTLLVVGPGPAVAALVKPATVTASSTYPEKDEFSYNPEQVSDRKVSNMWLEGEEGSGLGSWILLDLGKETEVSGITIYNGNWYSWDFWERHNRAKEIDIEFSDGSVQKHSLKDEKVPQVIVFEKPVKTRSIKVRVRDIYRGTTFNDTGFSEIEVFDTQRETWHQPSGVADSGHLPEDGDGSYIVENTFDNLLDTMWCENQKDAKTGDGTGSWFEQRFATTVPVSKLVLRNGNTYDMKLWMLSNRAKAATLIFSDGSKEAISIKDTLLDQTITFPRHTTSSVRIQFTEVVKGQKYNDLCISEAHFME